MSNLPATFRDAVLVTRRLGIAYLWIDALCIVQNDEEWLHESEIMGDIFHGAVCTIAVHTAQDDSCGFLKEASQPVSAIQAAKGPSDSQLFISTSSDFVRDVENSSLSGRAWVLQERHLSQRLLHFTDSHIYWEDHKGIQSDMVPVQWPFKTFHLHCLPPYSSSSSIGAWREENWKTLSRQWLKLVEMYSVCGITKDKDKLPAISGLAKRYHRVAGNGYLAGIWGENIHWGLLWSIKELIPSRPSYERAPSWSWASSDGTIYHPFCVDELVAVVELIKVELFSNGIFEPANWLVGPGRLTILVPLKHVNKIGTYGSIKTEEMGGGRRTQGRAVLEMSDQGTTEKIGWLALDKEDKTKGYKQGLWCVLIARYPHEPDDYVLFLVESGEEPRMYQRVGMGSIYGKHKWFADATSVEISIT